MAGSAHSHAAPRRRPELYAGARRRIGGVGPIIAGFIALVLVLGAMLTSELGHYSSQDDDKTALGDSSGLPSGQQPAAPESSGRAVIPQASPSPSSSPAASPSSSTAGKSISDQVATVLNKELASQGCAPLTVDPRLVANAQSHSVQMVNSGYYDVVSQGGTGPQARAKAAGYPAKVTESIVLGADTVQQAVAAGLPTAGADKPPAAVEVVAKNTLTCGWAHVGAQFSRDTRRVPVWSIVLGQ